MTVSEIKSNAFHNYVYSLIEFNCEIIIDAKLLGKFIPINLGRDNPCCICFPVLMFDRVNGNYKIVSSLSFSTTNIDIDNWGRLIQYKTNKNDQVVDKIVSISAVWIVSKLSNFEWVKSLKNEAEWFIRSIHAIKPTSIILKGIDTSKLISGFSYSYFDTTTGRGRSSGFESSLNMYLCNYDEIKIDIELIKTVLKAWKSKVSLPFELLLCAFQELRTKNYRNTILNCAMTIEVALKQLLRSSLSPMSINDAITDYIIKGADGLPKIERLMKLIDLPKYNFADIKANIFDVRNKIVHGGYFPSSDQASTALKLTQSILKDYHIAYFD